MTKAHKLAWERMAHLNRELRGMKELIADLGEEPCLKKQLLKIEAERWIVMGVIDRYEAKADAHFRSVGRRNAHLR